MCLINGNILILHEAVWLLESVFSPFCHKDFCPKQRDSWLLSFASVPWPPQELWGLCWGGYRCWVCAWFLPSDWWFVGFPDGSWWLCQAPVFYRVLCAFLLLEVLEPSEPLVPILYPRCLPCSLGKSFLWHLIKAQPWREEFNEWK